jgi:hypothetical protein
VKISDTVHLQILIFKIEECKETVAKSEEKAFHSCNNTSTNCLLRSNCKISLIKALTTERRHYIISSNAGSQKSIFPDVQNLLHIVPAHMFCNSIPYLPPEKAQ